MELLRLTTAARRVGVHPVTLRRWADEGRVAVVRVGRERRFSSVDLDQLLGREMVSERREALYLRVSGSSGQESSLAAREKELRESGRGQVVGVFRDRASGLRERRPGLDRLLRACREGRVSVVRVTNGDRLARFGGRWLSELLARDGVTVEVLHGRASADGMEELLSDFVSLVATFAGRMYGLRSKAARQRLLSEARMRVGESGETRG